MSNPTTPFVTNLPPLPSRFLQRREDAPDDAFMALLVLSIACTTAARVDPLFVSGQCLLEVCGTLLLGILVQSALPI